MPTQLPLTQPYLAYTAARAPAEMTQHLAQDPTLRLVPRAENQKDILLTAKSCVICSFGMWGYKWSPMRMSAPPFTYANFLLLWWDSVKSPQICMATVLNRVWTPNSQTKEASSLLTPNFQSFNLLICSFLYVFVLTILHARHGGKCWGYRNEI